MGSEFFSAEDLKELAETKVAERGDHLKPRSRSGRVVVTGVSKKETDMKGRAYFLDMRILQLNTHPEPVNGDSATNSVGQLVSKSFFIEDGSKKKQAAVRGDLVRTAVSIYNSMTGKNLSVKDVQADSKLLAQAMAAFQDSSGVLLEFTARDAVTEDGDHRTYHNIINVKQTKEQLAKNRELLSKDAPVTAFV